jgi:diguanylate cyclase
MAFTDQTKSEHELDSLAHFLAELRSEIGRCNEQNSVAVVQVALRRSDRVEALIVGDYANEVLDLIRLRINPVLRSKDRFVFVNENELWLILPQLTSEALAVLAVHRLLGCFLGPIKHRNATIFITPCIGIASAPLHSTSPMALLRAAETAQKNALAGHHKFLMAERDSANQIIPEDLHQALTDVLHANELNVEYQPKVDIRQHKMVSVEALVRWPSAHLHHVPTTLLIEVAERSGLVEALTMRVLAKALQDLLIWKSEGLNVLVWVNLSARLLELDQLPKILMRTLDIWGIPAHEIGLEITESAFIQDIDHSTNMLFELKQLGFHLAIDDFGTGYSSLTYLRRFPIDELKIDRMFIHGMTTSQQDRQIVQSIIDLAHNFGLPVVAEGVENEETLHQLKAMNCDQIQGYYFSRPMPANKLLEWHAKYDLEHE